MSAPMDDVMQRFWRKVSVQPEGCWIWTGYVGASGYGRFSISCRELKAHRAAYELLVGPIPDGLQIDHLCRVRACVNPEHLEPVTQAENIARGLVGYSHRTTCRSGRHDITLPGATYTSPQGNTTCAICRRERTRIAQAGYRAAKRDARAKAMEAAR